MRRRYMSNKTKVFEDTIVQFENDKSGSYAVVEIKGDFAEGTTFKLTRCGINLINTNLPLSDITTIQPGLNLSNNIFTLENNGGGVSIVYKPNLNAIKPNMQYTMFVNVLENTLVGKFILNSTYLAKSTFNEYWQENETMQIGVHKNLVATLNDISSCDCIFWLNKPATTTGKIALQIMLFQGNQTELKITNSNWNNYTYTGEIFTITPNTPTKIPLLNGVNTFFTDSDVTLKVTTKS